MPAIQSTYRGTATPTTPPVAASLSSLQAALDLIVARNSCSDTDFIRERTLAFLRATRALVSSPDERFAQELVSHCLTVRFPRDVAATDSQGAHSKVLAFLPQTIIDGFQRVHRAEFYNSPNGPLAFDIRGVRAFQRDLVAHLNQQISLLESRSDSAASTEGAIAEVSRLVLLFHKKNPASEPTRKMTSAHILAHLLKNAPAIDLPLLQITTSILAQRESFDPLKSAINPLLNKAREIGVTVSHELEASLREWAAQGAPLSLQQLLIDKRASILQSLQVATIQLMKGEVGEALQREWLVALHDLSRADKDIADNQESALHDQPTQDAAARGRFTRLARLNERELRDLSCAAEALRREGLTGLHLEIDQSLFVWPRIAEALLVTRPYRITLHSPAAEEPFDREAPSENKPFLCRRAPHVIPLSLLASPLTILEREAYLASGAAIQWISPTQGSFVTDSGNTQIDIDPLLCVSELMRGYMPRFKPDHNYFTLRDPRASVTEQPLVLGTLLSNRLVSIAGFTTHTFGDTVQLFIAQDRKPIPPPVTKPLGTSTKNAKREKAPAAPPIREARPTISGEQALVAKAVIASLPEIQGAARASNALKPFIPFSQADIVTTLHILRNGEKPGNKALKALRAYIRDDNNFRDSIRSSTIRTVRADLEKLLEQLLA